ncbi:hypothetical protein OG21DRAFT_1484091 [Imleria badia]|nr:hypothetical protein OG21DRAFT_1484091 [Imleria badia]
MKDYMSDQQFVKPLLFNMLVEDLDAFLITYLTALVDSPSYAYPQRRSPDKELEKYFEVVEQILAMLEVPKSMGFLSFWAFSNVHGPCLPFVEGLMKARGDLGRTTMSEVMEAVKRKVEEEGLTDPLQHGHHELGHDQRSPEDHEKALWKEDPNAADFDDCNIDRENTVAGILEDDSPYPKVRSAVANTDDRSIPASTLRACVLGMRGPPIKYTHTNVHG